MISSYKNYVNSRDLAWQILLDYKLIHFPLNIFNIFGSMEISLKSFAKSAAFFNAFNIVPNSDALCCIISDMCIVCYNQCCTNIKQLRLILAHELGHLMLGHATPGINHFFKNCYETDANVFARCFLMPAIVCKHEKLFSAQCIANFFGVTLQAAQIKAQRVNMLVSHNKFLTSPLEQQYYNLYKYSKLN